MRLIDADALKNAHNMGDECDKCETKWKECQYYYIYSKMDFCTWIDDAQTIDAVEVKHGTWTVDGINEYELSYGSTGYEPVYRCSICGHITESYLRLDRPIMPEDADFPKYCPNCGAKMDGKEKNNE